MFSGSGANGTTYRIKVTVSDNAGNLTSISSASNFTMDSELPTLIASQMTVNGIVSGGSTNTNYVQISLKAADLKTKITHFCLKYNDFVAPDANSVCWAPVSAAGQTASTNLTLTNYSFALGMGTSLYHVYAWVKDQASNISAMSTNDGKDHVSINYTSPSPPTITGVIGATSATPAIPLGASDLTINAGTTVYIQWNVTSAPSGLGSTPISLFYTTDNLTYTPIASAQTLANGANGCNPDVNHSGCFKWTNGSPANTFFAVRAVVTDNANITAANASSPINSWPPINFLAGATDSGTNGSASSAMFKSSSANFGDGQSFVVSDKGVIYFRDRMRGILKVDPTTGNQTILLPKVSFYTDGTATGIATGATVASATRLALDFQGRLLIAETNAVRRYDPSTNQVSTIIGGPSAINTADTSSASTTKISMGVPYQFGATPLFAVPDGRIYLASESSSRFRIYTPADSTVRSILYSGTGTSDGPAEAISAYSFIIRFFGFDPLTSEIDALMALLMKNGSAVYRANFNPSTGAAIPGTFMDNPGDYTFVCVPGMNGEVYAFSSGKIIRYSKMNLSWTNVAGSSSSGVSTDGSVANTSRINPQDIFVNASGKVFFFERGVIRTIDQAGRISTLAGASRSSGDDANALNARIGFIDDFKIWNDGLGGGDTIVFADSTEAKFRQFKIGGNMQKIAGNGSVSSPTTSAVAVSQPLNTSIYSDLLFQVHPTNGSIYSNARFSGLSVLDSATNLWTDWVGTGSSYNYRTGDSKDGSTITQNSYPPLVLGFDGNRVLAGWNRYEVSFYADGLIKSYPITGGHTQSSFAGALGTVNNANICASGTPLSSCLLTALGTGQVLNQLYWDSYASTWVGMIYNTSSTAGKRVFTMTEGGNLTDIASLPSGAYAFTRRHDASHDIIYYCAGNDSKLHKFDVTTSTDMTYPWPIPQMQCGSHNLIYNSTRNSLIFAYQVNGLWGIAEYLNP